MRVPTRSAGTRSGVNWTRWNCPPMAAATDFTASVLARPGTPSTRMWPRASRATTSRSRSTSWPTMVRLTSYSTCSIGLPGSPVRMLGAGGWKPGCHMSSRGPSSRPFIGSCPPQGQVMVMWWSLRWLVAATGDDRHADGHGEADPDEEPVVGRIGDGDDDPDHLAGGVEQRTARAARVDRRVELDQAVA